MVPAILTVWYPLLDTFYERSTRYPLHCAHFVCLSSQYPLSSTFYKVPFPVLQSTGNPLHGIICMVTFATWYPLYATLPGTFYTLSYLYRVLFALYPRHATFHTVNFKLHLLQGTFYFSISFCWFFRSPTSKYHIENNFFCHVFRNVVYGRQTDCNDIVRLLSVSTVYEKLLGGPHTHTPRCMP